MCMPKTPDIPDVIERQAAKLPDSGSTARTGDASSRRRALMAGLITTPSGLGSPTVSKPTLG